VIQRGLDWLVETQNQDGGWTQGEDSGRGRDGEVLDHSNVADSCNALLALLRSGGSPKSGALATVMTRGAGFVCGQIEASDADSLWVTDVRNTRVQMKIGTYVDTFLSSLVLAELKGRMASAAENQRVDAALAKVIHKIEKNQQTDGRWAGSGWAPVLGQSLAGKGLNRAAQNGAEVSQLAIQLNRNSFAAVDGVKPAAESAGVALYAGASELSVLQDTSNTDAMREQSLREELSKTKDEKRRDELEKDLGRIVEGKEAQQAAQTAMIDRLDEPGFVSGFGSNGGEEFLSYMNISESLVLRGDDQWRQWDVAMAKNLERVQNQDGSWSGHHCITGRTFCTSAALLVLLADRTPVPSELVAKAR
jgi:hypothetical protein